METGSVANADTTTQKKRISREARQQQILDATVKCIRRRGFHGASMGDIAHEAQMSVGVIYRYFANKEAILEAIAGRDLAEMRAKFAEFETMNRDGLIDTVVANLDIPLTQQFDRERSALALEMVAEASRNPKVEAIMHGIDRQGRDIGRDFLRRITSGAVGDGQLDARSEILKALMDGMMIRGVLNPDSNREDVADVFKKVFRYILTLPA